jgi:hypothetical protein
MECVIQYANEKNKLQLLNSSDSYVGVKV